MKTKILAMTFGLLGIFSSAIIHAQTTIPKLKVVVLNIDTKNISYDPVQMGNLVRVELEKLDTFDVMDRYDVQYLVDKDQLKIANCYGKIALVDIGKTLGVDKMLTGSVEQFGDVIIYTMRFIDVKTESIEKTQVTEFLNQTNELQTMTAVMLRQLFNKPIEENVVSQLIKPDDYSARARVPVTEKINLTGPRMGVPFFTGTTAKILAAPTSQGGYKAFPLMFQFGYQFEKQYLAAGEFQALFEFIPMITGLDQGIAIPSFTIMNGLRANRHGWEFAFGPSINLIRKSEGFYNSTGIWERKQDWQSDPLSSNQSQPTFENRLDSRGTYELNSSFVFAFGKTFRSGTMNIPVNFYGIPGRDGWRFGLSFGYNARNRPTKK